MTSEYEKLRLKNISLNKEVLEDLGLKEIRPLDLPKRKIRPTVPKEPVRKSQRIYELAKKKELKELERRKNASPKKKKKTTKKKTTQKKATKKKEPKKKEPEPKVEETSPEPSDQESEEKLEPNSDSNSESDPDYFYSDSDSLSEQEPVIRRKSNKNTESNSYSYSDSEPTHGMPLRQSSYPKLSPVRKQRAPITVDTTMMFSPIKTKVNDTRKYDEEWYTKDDLPYLGSCRQRYPFMNIAKVADTRGTVCHQCLQRTRDKKTSCLGCRGPNGVICGQCLQTRYGENILEVFQKGNKWRCPSCRGICNCNACRELKNLQPIGSVCVNTLGYPSVAHWIMYTHLKK